MNTWIDFELDTLIRWAVSAFFSITIWLAMIALIAWVWGRRRAATRHAVWLCGLLGIVCIPLILPIVPHHIVSLGLMRTAPDSVSIKSTAQVGDGGARQTSNIPSRLGHSDWPIDPIELESVRIDRPSASPLPSPRESAAAMPIGNTAGPAFPGRASTPPGFPWAGWIVLVWGLGSAILLARVALGWRRLRAIRASAVLLDEVDYHSVIARVKVLAASHPLPPILVSPHVKVPSVGGCLRPVVLLPVEVLRRSSEEWLLQILVHELAHVWRKDPWVLCLQRLVTACLWPHPLVHLMNRELARAREELCDNQVLNACRAVDYAETLLALGRLCLNGGRLGQELSIVRGGHRLVERVRVVLDRHRDRSPVLNTSRRLVLSLLAGVLGYAAVAFRIELSTQAGEATSGEDPPREAKGIRGRVVDPSGNAIEGARVRMNGFDWKTSTDKQGRFVWASAPWAQWCEVSKEGYLDVLVESLKPDGTEHSLVMSPAPRVKGEVIDSESGEPVPGFTVYAAHLLRSEGGVAVDWNSKVAGEAGRFAFSFERPLGYDSAVYVEAAGYRDMVSTRISAQQEGETVQFAMRKAEPVRVKVLAPTGEAVDRASVWLWCGEIGYQYIPSHHRAVTDSNGVCSIPPIIKAMVIAKDTSGYAELPLGAIADGGVIQLEPWGQVRVRWAGSENSFTARRLRLEAVNWTDQLYTRRLEWGDGLRALGVGGIGSTAVAPGEYWVCDLVSVPIHWNQGAQSMMVEFGRRALVSVSPGQNSLVDLPPGRTVSGVVAPPEGETLGPIAGGCAFLDRVLPPGPDISWPRHVQPVATDEEVQAIQDYYARASGYWQSDEGKLRRRAERRYLASIDKTGEFRFASVPEGKYRLMAHVSWEGPPFGQSITATRDITVPRAAEDEVTLEVGTLEIISITPGTEGHASAFVKH